MKKKFSSIAICLLTIVIMLLLFIRPLSWQTDKSNVNVKDTTIYNVEYRDTTIYNIQKKDSVITDYTLVPANDTVIINDTVYIVLPLSAYHFGDSLVDIYVTGYNVTLDSFLLHRREMIVTTQKEVVIQPKRLTTNVGVSLFKCDGWNLMFDGNANFRINDKWSIDANIGIVATGDKLLPFAKGGFKYHLGSP